MYVTYPSRPVASNPKTVRTSVPLSDGEVPALLRLGPRIRCCLIGANSPDGLSMPGLPSNAMEHPDPRDPGSSLTGAFRASHLLPHRSIGHRGRKVERILILYAPAYSALPSPCSSQFERNKTRGYRRSRDRPSLLTRLCVANFKNLIVEIYLRGKLGLA